MKVCLIGDLHFGIKRNDAIFRISQMKFYREQMIPELKEKGIDTIFVLGDVFDNRNHINVSVMNDVLKLFKEDLADFKIHIIVGNHDLYYTNNTSTHSLKMLNLLPNCIVYEKPTNVDFDGTTVTFLPWICDYETVKDIQCTSKYAFAHLDVVGFSMGFGITCSSGANKHELYEKFDHIYTGHFHERSEEREGNKNITYIGSPYELVNNEKTTRGYTVLDLSNNEHYHVENTKSIKFINIVYDPKKESSEYEQLVNGNIVNITVNVYDSGMSDIEKNVYLFLSDIKKFNPAYDINVSINYVDSNNTEQLVVDDVDNMKPIDLLREYINTTENIHPDYKDRVYSRIKQKYDELCLN